LPFEHDTEISGVFRLTAWISIDQPDTDFAVNVYEIREDGGSTLLAGDQLRARYRESLREPKLIQTKAPLRYDFTHFTFVSWEVKKGSRLRLVLEPINSIYNEKNYNSGGIVAQESLKDARTVNVTLYHDRAHPSALSVPLAKPVAGDELEPPGNMFTAGP
jgi:predicted acyl esterase